MVISNRVAKLLRILAEANDYVSISELSTRMELSQRTIYREMDAAEDVCATFGVEIVRTSKKGLRLKGAASNLRKMMEEVYEADIFLIDADARINHILVYLLHAKDYVSLESLSEDMDASLSTVRSDVIQAENILRHSNLTLVRDRGKGIMLKGTQPEKDKLFLNILLGSMDMDVFYQYLKAPDKPNVLTNRISMSYLKKYGYMPYIFRLHSLFYHLNKDLIKEGYHFGKTYYIEFILMLSFFINHRKTESEVYYVDEEVLRKDNSDKYLEFSLKIVEALQNEFDIPISTMERKYIQWILSICIFSYDVELEGTLSSGIDLFVQKTISYYGKELVFDEKTNVLLKTHIKNALVRIENHITIVNTMLDYISQNMLDLYEAIEKALVDVFPAVSFPPEEIAYIALYFALVLEKMKAKSFRVLAICSGGMGSSRMLASRLESEISEIEEAKCVSIGELDSVNLFDYDLILSTIPLFIDGLDYMRVSALLSDREVKAIKQKLNDISKKD